MDYPADADGDALRRVAQGGSDMSKPMDIDFAVAASDKASATAIARAARTQGFEAEVHRDEGGRYSCYCKRMMIATYDAVVQVQAELDSLSRPLGGYADGWGTFGNCPEPTSRQ